ncbi:[Wnt protein] O-palmitoleoyl-L-serine hydrolase [Ranunculus cassubicifolius]
MRLREISLISLSRKCGKRDCTISAAIFTILSFALIAIFNSSKDTTDVIRSTNDESLIELTLLPNAKLKGAVCLDGSPPGYHFQKGFGSGSNNWLLHIEGGGWCSSIESCIRRQSTALGSSNYMGPAQFSGIFSQDASHNPDFFNWNKLKIRYCDGASLSGHPGGEFQNGTKLFFRGQLIWKAIIDEVLPMGLADAKQALLSGCSAGGLATLIHCDDFREALPNNANVKCLADAAFFIDEKDISGNYTMRSFYRDVAHLQGVMRTLHKDCVSKMEPYKARCLFPQEIIKNIKTPVFLVDPAYDFWQIQNILAPDVSDLHQNWTPCKLDIKKCNQNQLEVLQGFRKSLLDAASGFLQNKGGVYINSCFIHCQTWMSSTWHSPNSPRVNNKTIAEAVGDWYFNRRGRRVAVQEIDCPYPCNPTCHNMDFS